MGSLSPVAGTGVGMSVEVLSWSALRGSDGFGIVVPFDSARMPIREVCASGEGLSWVRADGRTESLCASGSFQEVHRALFSDEGLLVAQINESGVCVDATVIDMAEGGNEERQSCLG